jgi:hypothetical protein
MTTTERTPPVSITELCRSIQPLLLHPVGAPPTGTRRRVRLLPGIAQKVSAPPLPLYAAVDGVQASTLLTYRSQRPVHLVWTAAGAVGPPDPGERDWKVRTVRQDLAIVCSHLDEDWARSRPGGARVVALDESYDEQLRPATSAWLDARRRELEQQVLSALVVPDERWVIVDGSLAQLPSAPRRLGAVKTATTQYLPNEEEEVCRLKMGWMSRSFRIESTRRGEAARASAYVRLHDPSHRPWNHGLIRLEVLPEEADALPSAARLALACRQGPGSGDARWDRHLFPVAHTEYLLGAWRPPVVFGS